MGRGKSKNVKPYGPGGISSDGHSIYWPAHPLANGSGEVSLVKLKTWQEKNFDGDALSIIKVYRQGAKVPDIWFGGPGAPSIRGGYIIYEWPNHPLNNTKDRHKVLEHHLVYWQEHEFSDNVLHLLKFGGGTIHHRNGKRDDNRPENLELRIAGSHPVGVGEQDMVDVLTKLGYGITPPGAPTS